MTGSKRHEKRTKTASTPGFACAPRGARSPHGGSLLTRGTIGALLLLSACSKQIDRGNANSTVPPLPASVLADATSASPIRMSARELWQAYETNETAAAGYQGKMLLVTGTVRAIGKNEFDNVVVHLSAPDDAQSVHATVQSSSEKDKAASLSQGQSVSVLCIGGTKGVAGPTLSHCSIEG
jgi:putative nucleic acid binding protein